MGNNSSKEDHQDKKTVQILKEYVEKNGKESLGAFIEENLDKWKDEKVQLAVTGMTATGKSAFINAINNAKIGDSFFAPQGHGNTTKKPTPYKRKENIVLWDLPGVGTDLFRQKSYIADMKLNTFDFFFLFFYPVITETDIWLAETLLGMNKPFCFVRSKIDDDIESAEFDGKNPDTVIEEVRNKARECLNRNEQLQNYEDIFFISSRKPNKGQMNELISLVESRLSLGKHEAILFALPMLTKQVINIKYDKLRERLVYVTAAASAVSATPIPILDVALNMKIIYNEIQHYVDVFGLSNHQLESLKDFDKSKLKWVYISNYKDVAKLIMSGIVPIGTGSTLLVAESILDLILPVVGSIISATTTAKMVHTYLNRVLSDIRDDAIVVLEHIQKKHD